MGDKSGEQRPKPQSHNAEFSQLMRSALAGDDAAYQTLLRQLPMVLRSVFRASFQKFRMPPSDQEDIIQDVLIILHIRRHRWNPDLPLLPWVFAIAHNKIIDEVRRRSRRRDMEAFLLPEDDNGKHLEGVFAAHDAARMLGTLPPRNRKIVSSISIEGYTARELASELGISEGAVRIVLHRSLRGLAENFAQLAIENE
jgi:RNA polymerase sigma-70 factor, ECF subfamily